MRIPKGAVVHPLFVLISQVLGELLFPKMQSVNLPSQSISGRNGYEEG